MTRRRAALLAIMAAVLVNPFGVITAHAVVQEDSAHWDCRTMGDTVCGPGYARYCHMARVRYCNDRHVPKRVEKHAARVLRRFNPQNG